MGRAQRGPYLDPVYTGKAMAGLIQLTAVNDLAGYRVLFWHTGGTPALFGYGDQLVEQAAYCSGQGARGEYALGKIRKNAQTQTLTGKLQDDARTGTRSFI